MKKVKFLSLMLAMSMLVTTIVPTNVFASDYSIFNEDITNTNTLVSIKTNDENDSVVLDIRALFVEYLREHSSVTSVGKTKIDISFSDVKDYSFELDAGTHKFELSNFPMDGEYKMTISTTYIWGKDNIKTVDTSKYSFRVMNLDEPTDNFDSLVFTQSDTNSINDEFSYEYNESESESYPEHTEEEAEEIVKENWEENNQDNSNNETVEEEGTYVGTEEDLDKEDNKDTNVVKSVAKPTITKAVLNNKSLTLKVSTKDKTRTGIQYRICYKNGSKVYKVAEKKTKKLSFTVKNLKKNNIYYVQVRSYTTKNGKTTYSSWSSKKYVIQQTTVSKKAKNTIKWTKINGAKSYTVYASTKKNGKYYKIKTVKSNTLKFTKINKKKYKTAYIKVVVNGNNKTKSTSKLYKLK